MITSSDIKAIFEYHIPKGQWVPLTNIFQTIENNFDLDDEDWEPHTETRPTTYPKWKNRTNAVLEELKKDETIKHDPLSTAYMF